MKDLKLKFPTKRKMCELVARRYVEFYEEEVKISIWKFRDIEMSIKMFQGKFNKFHLYLNDNEEIGEFSSFMQDCDKEYPRMKRAATKAFKKIVKEFYQSIEDNNNSNFKL